MKELSFERMEEINGGISLSCGLALAATGISIATFLITPYAALPILLWGGGHLIATVSVIDSCMT